MIEDEERARELARDLFNLEQDASYLDNASKHIFAYADRIRTMAAERGAKYFLDTYGMYLINHHMPVKVKELMTAITGKETTISDKDKMTSEQVKSIRDLLCKMELNFCNYDDDQVRELQGNVFEAVNIIDSLSDDPEQANFMDDCRMVMYEKGID